MKKTEIFEGGRLENSVPTFPENQPRCFLIGKNSDGKKTKIPLSEEYFSKHVLFFGGIGMGKTNAIFQLLSQLKNSLTENDVLVIFDTKGDYYKDFFEKGDIVISNDEKATGCKNIDYWNIFKEVSFNDEEIEENINEISRTLFFEKIKKSTQPFFPNAASDLFSAILLHLVRENKKENLNNYYLRNLLNKSTPLDLRNILYQHEDLKAITNYIMDDRSPQTQGVISELQQLIREIFIGKFKNEGNIGVRESIRNKGGKAIFIEYDLGIGSTLTPIYRLLLDMGLKESLGRKKSDGNVWFVIDEFRLIPNLKHIDDGVNFGRSLGVKFIIGVQNIGQLYYEYGESLTKSILSGFNSQIVFRVNDFETRQFIKDTFGCNRKLEFFSSSVQSRGLVEEVRNAYVLEDWDIINLPVGNAIIGLPGTNPFLFKFDLFDSIKA